MNRELFYNYVLPMLSPLFEGSKYELRKSKYGCVYATDEFKMSFSIGFWKTGPECSTTLSFSVRLNKVEEIKATGVTIISTMHDITLGAMYAERIIIMQSGRVLLDGESQSVIHSPELRSAFDDRISVHMLENGRPVIIAAKRDITI